MNHRLRIGTEEHYCRLLDESREEVEQEMLERLYGYLPHRIFLLLQARCEIMESTGRKIPCSFGIPGQKLAVFCDHGQRHRSEGKLKPDYRATRELQYHGWRALRFRTCEINFDNPGEIIKRHYDSLTRTFRRRSVARRQWPSYSATEHFFALKKRVQDGIENEMLNCLQSGLPDNIFVLLEAQWKEKTLFFTITPDFAFQEEKIAIFCDSREHHHSYEWQFKQDNRVTRVLQSLGWRVLRYTASEIKEDNPAADVRRHYEGITELFERRGVHEGDV